MEETIKNIISRYIKIPVDQINEHTVINRSSVTSSILLHRMYADLADSGIVIDNYLSINNYAELAGNINGSEPTDHPVVVQAYSYPTLPATTSGVGIDIEEIRSMPVVNDFREAEFYKMNFAASEIAYCILQPSPLASFAGLFAAKEAIVKANELYKNRPFHTIVIEHLPNGKPYYQDFNLSISHTNEVVVAIAILIINPLTGPGANPSQYPGKKFTTSPQFIFIVAVIAFILSLVAILLFTVYHVL